MPTRPTTLASKGRRCIAADVGALPARRLIPAEKVRLSVGMTATLCAQLDGRVAAELVADIVRAVLDESRHTSQHCEVEPMMIVARQRAERFIRARVPR